MNPISIEDYFERSGDEIICEGNKEKNDNGFCVWRTDGERFILVQVYGDGDYWNKWSENKSRELGMKKYSLQQKENHMALLRNSVMKSLVISLKGKSDG